MATALQTQAGLKTRCVERFKNSPYRVPGKFNPEEIASCIAPVIDAFAIAVLPDRAGKRPDHIEFRPGLQELRDIEQTVAFLASRAGANQRTKGGSLSSGFDVGALLLALRDVLTEGSTDGERKCLQDYMEWLTVLAGESLAHGREHALSERFSNELEEGTPLLMITSELPALVFVCGPNLRVLSGMFGRLLLTMVRTGAKAAIIDVRGIAGAMSPDFFKSLSEFLNNPRVGKGSTIFACGVKREDLSTWSEIGEASGTAVVFENYFDVCVSSALECAGWRVLPGAS